MAKKPELPGSQKGHLIITDSKINGRVQHLSKEGRMFFKVVLDLEVPLLPQQRTVVCVSQPVREARSISCLGHQTEANGSRELFRAVRKQRAHL